MERPHRSGRLLKPPGRSRNGQRGQIYIDLLHLPIHVRFGFATASQKPYAPQKLDRLLDTLEKAQQLLGLATGTPWIGDIRNGACGVVLRSRRGRRRQPPRTCRILIEVAGFSLGGVTA